MPTGRPGVARLTCGPRLPTAKTAAKETGWPENGEPRWKVTQTKSKLRAPITLFDRKTGYRRYLRDVAQVQDVITKQLEREAREREGRV